MCEGELQSRTTFNLYLKKLVEEHKINRDRKSRKNVLYQVNPRNPEMRDIIKLEDSREDLEEYLSRYSLRNIFAKEPKPRNQKERITRLCEDLAYLLTRSLNPESYLFQFVENRAKATPVERSYLEYDYRRIIETILLKALPRELERLRRRDPQLFECGRMALETYRGDMSSLVQYLVSEVTRLSQAPRPPTMSQIRRDEQKRLKAGPMKK